MKYWVKKEVFAQHPFFSPIILKEEISELPGTMADDGQSMYHENPRFFWDIVATPISLIEMGSEDEFPSWSSSLVICTQRVIKRSDINDDEICPIRFLDHHAIKLEYPLSLASLDIKEEEYSPLLYTIYGVPFKFSDELFSIDKFAELICGGEEGWGQYDQPSVKQHLQGVVTGETINVIPGVSAISIYRNGERWEKESVSHLQKKQADELVSRLNDFLAGTGYEAREHRMFFNSVQEIKF